MSNAVSVLNEASFKGAVKVADTGLRGMITLRGDLSSEAVAKGVKSGCGQSVPSVRGVKSGAKGTVAWMSSDELLLIVDYADADAVVAKMVKALGDAHSLVVNVSDARAVFSISGKGAREVLAKGAPVDLSTDAFEVGMIRRTRLGQNAVAFWMNDEQSFELVCFRSVGDYVYKWLCTAAQKGTLPGVL